MKEFISQRSPLEKKFITVGLLILLIILIYSILIVPIRDEIRELHEDIQSNRQLLEWIKLKAPLIQKLRQQNVAPTKDILLTVQAPFNTMRNDVKPEFKKISATQVSVTFKQIDFDTLIQDLIHLWQNQHVDVESIQVQSLNHEGLVQANVVLTRH